MNRSGLAVKTMINQGGVKPEKLVVVYDDVDIPLGEIRIRKEGGAGTHKGIISIIEEINTTKFPRIRIGIGSADPAEERIDFVLSSFHREEEPFLEQSLKLAREALNLVISGETERAMNVYNRKGRGRQAS